MNLKHMLPTSVLCLACASGCTDLSPACEAPLAQKEILQMIREKAPYVSDAHIERVHTLRTNFATGEVLCSAAIVGTDAQAEQLRLSVGYNVHFDKRQQIAVTVYGVP